MYGSPPPPVAATTLPRPEVVVNHRESQGAHSIDVVVSRPGSGEPKQYRGESTSFQGAVKGVVERIFDDPHSAEFIRNPREGA